MGNSFFWQFPLGDRHQWGALRADETVQNKNTQREALSTHTAEGSVESVVKIWPLVIINSDYTAGGNRIAQETFSK